MKELIPDKETRIKVMQRVMMALDKIPCKRVAWKILERLFE